VTNYSSNSHKTREKSSDDAPKERRKVEKVITGSVVQKKKTLGSKVAETFMGENLKSVAVGVLMDVVIPKAKDMFLDALNQGAERAVYGETRGRSSSTRDVRRPTSYNGMYNGGGSSRDESSSRSFSQQSRATHNFDDIVLETRGEAERVLTELCNLIDDYETATVADLYELVEITPNFQDDKWGWVDLGPASISRQRKGFLLNLPRPIDLDN
jgi:hypothetical protein